MRKYQVISGDGHLEGPFDFTSLMPEKYKDAVPRMVQREDRAWTWRTEYGGATMNFLVGSNVYSGLRYDQFVAKNACTYWKEDGSPKPGCSTDPVIRLREQDQDGIDAEILYFPAAVGGLQMLSGVDVDAYKAGIRMYTDFLAEYCSVAPDRLIGCMLLPNTGIDDAIAEIDHGRNRGLRAICLQNWPNGSGDPSPDDDRFWAATIDLEMRVAPHVSFGALNPRPHEIMVGPERTVGGYNQFANSRTSMSIAQMIYAGVFDRFPNFKIYFAESECAWLAGWLEYIDEFYQRWAPFHGIELSKMPSDYVRDHCMFCFISDRMAVPLRHYIGTELITWGSDFPHSVGTFPDSKYVLDDFFEGVPESERRQMLVTNHCNFFGLDPDHELTPTP
jgi:predicted TIM-barrel fold metal-dependent hydrolase